MPAKQIIARILLILAVPFVLLGLIDPLEGGISLAAALLIYLLAFILLRQKPSRWLWIPFATALVLGAVTLALAIARLEFSPGPSPLPGPVIFGLWGYRLAVAATLVGAVMTAVRSFQNKK